MSCGADAPCLLFLLQLFANGHLTMMSNRTPLGRSKLAKKRCRSSRHCSVVKEKKKKKELSPLFDKESS